LKTILAILSVGLLGLLALAQQRSGNNALTDDRLLKAQAEPQNWLMYWGNYQGTHFSSLKQVDKTNVDKIRAVFDQYPNVVGTK